MSGAENVAALLELAAKVEAAEANAQYDLIMRAWFIVNGDREAALKMDETALGEWTYAKRFFERLLGVGGYTHAAITLVPEGWRLTRLADTTLTQAAWQSGPWVAQLTQDKPFELAGSEHGSTPALALCAAALRARAAS